MAARIVVSRGTCIVANTPYSGARRLIFQNTTSTTSQLAKLVTPITCELTPLLAAAIGAAA
jgi:hypothetical protein